jgi:methyl-accepting chemotaxis protein
MKDKGDRQFEILDGRLIVLQVTASRILISLREGLKKMSELSDAVQAVADDVTRIGDDVSQVLALLQQPNPDVAAAVEALKKIDADLDSTAESMENVVSPPAEPPA